MNYELDCKWHFAEMDANAGDEGPNSAMSQTFAQFPCAALVRESIQNSLDAVLDEKNLLLCVLNIAHLIEVIIRISLILLIISVLAVTIIAQTNRPMQYILQC